MKALFIFIVLFASPMIALAEQACVTKNGFPMSDSEENLKNFIQFFDQKDAEACVRMMEAGKVAPTSPGQECFVERVGVFGPVIKIRIKGYTQYFYTTESAVSCSNKF
jgi:hypothetical protein